MKKEIIYGERTRKVVGETVGPLSHGVKVTGVGSIIFISGQVSYVNGKVVGEGDVAAQYKQIMENMKAILEDAGASMNDIVKLVHYMTTKVEMGTGTTLDDVYPQLKTIRKQYITKDFPVSTMVEVYASMIPGCLIEADAIAVTD